MENFNQYKKIIGYPIVKFKEGEKLPPEITFTKKGSYKVYSDGKTDFVTYVNPFPPVKTVDKLPVKGISQGDMIEVSETRQSYVATYKGWLKIKR